MPDDSAWEPWILNQMAPGAVTFAWDDREVRTIRAPPGVGVDRRAPQGSRGRARKTANGVLPA